MSADTVLVTYAIDRDELARRGRLGAAATHARYDGQDTTAPARAAFERKFGDPETRRAYFSEMGKRSGVARRARKAAQTQEGGR